MHRGSCFSTSWLIFTLMLTVFHFFLIVAVLFGGFPWWFRWEGIHLQCQRPEFDPCFEKIPWRGGMATHSSILAWRIPWTEEPGSLQSMGSQRAGHKWLTLLLFISFGVTTLMFKFASRYGWGGQGCMLYIHEFTRLTGSECFKAIGNAECFRRHWCRVCFVIG